MNKYIKFALIGLLIAFVVIQFFPGDERVNERMTSNDITEQIQIDSELSSLLQNACYDCHSNQPKHPWYASIAPLSWKVKEHIADGRSELNFSEWGTYSAKKRDHKLEEMIEEVQEGKMPLNEYRWFHPEGRLTKSQIAMLSNWVTQERNKILSEPSALADNTPDTFF